MFSFRQGIDVAIIYSQEVDACFNDVIGQDGNTIPSAPLNQPLSNRVAVYAYLGPRNRAFNLVNDALGDLVGLLET